MSDTGEANQIVGFFDILGTSEMVQQGYFGDATALDFVNPPGIVARYLPDVRFAAFSDSVLIATDTRNVTEFLAALSFVHRQWFADTIAVRGGIAVGALRWAEFEGMEKLFRGLSKFRYARVYGTGLVDASRLEQKAGPGAISYLTDSAADLLRDAIEESVMSAHAHMLVWPHERNVEFQLDFYARLLQSADRDTTARRHYQVTHWYFSQLHERQQFLPDDRLPAIAGM